MKDERVLSTGSPAIHRPQSGLHPRKMQEIHAPAPLQDVVSFLDNNAENAIAWPQEKRRKKKNNNNITPTNVQITHPMTALKLKKKEPKARFPTPALQARDLLRDTSQALGNFKKPDRGISKNRQYSHLDQRHHVGVKKN